jgi:hypothetical protein
MTYKRWFIVFRHDHSPLDECIFTHKAKALDKLDTLSNKNKLTVAQLEFTITKIVTS